jgi:FG-GAP-like repeat
MNSNRISVLLAFVAFAGTPAIPRLNAQSNPLPAVMQPLMPSSAVPGGPDFTLTVEGSGFVQGSVVTWNGSPRATKLVSGSQLKASILASDIAATGTASIAVVSAGPVSNTVFFPTNTPVVSVTLGLQNVPNGGGGSFQTNAADFNGDGKLDLVYVVPCPNGGNGCIGGQVVVRLGNGDGTFQAAAAFLTAQSASTQSWPTAFATGDFNGDGKVDLAVVNSYCEPYNCLGGGTVGILLGNGDGTFQPATEVPVGNQPEWVVAADFNNDGRLDLVVPNVQDGTVSVLLGKGDGTFQSQVTFPVRKFLNSNITRTDIAVADFNGDGKMDLALIDVDNTILRNDEISVYLGNGDGTFRLFTTIPWGIFPTAILTADFNGDGIPDLAAVDE